MLSHIVPCHENEDGDLYFELPDELLDATGWKEGTTLEVIAEPGSITLRERKTEERKRKIATGDSTQGS